MFSDRRSFVLLSFIVLFAASCSKAPEGQTSARRIAVLPIEDLSPQPVFWGPRALAAMVAARSGADVFDVPDLASAQIRRSTHTISGYVTRSQQGMTVTGTVRDETTGKATITFHETATDLLTLSEKIGRAAGLSVKPYTTTNAAAIEAYFSALLQADESGFVRAVNADPQYGAPQVALAEIYARSNRPEDLQRVLASARAARLTPLEAARLELVQTQLTPNPRQRLAAMAKVVRHQPGDVPMQRNLVQAALSVSDFRLAANASKELLEVDPGDEVALNSLGYAATFAGNKAEAERAFDQYRKALPRSANALDSYAEALFYFGDYGRAAPMFLEAHKLDANHAGGHEPVRAALAYYLAGDRNRADQVFNEWLALRTAQGDSLAPTRKLIWQRWTKVSTRNSELPFDSAIRALWALEDGNRAQAAQLGIAVAKNPASPPAARNTAGMALLLAQPSASADVWTQRIGAAVRDPSAARAGQQLLAWALLLDGKPAEAATVLRPLFDRTAPTQSNEARILLATALLRSKQLEEARKVMPHGFFPPVNINPEISALLYPMAYETVRALR